MESWKGFQRLDFHRMGEELLKNLGLSYHQLLSSTEVSASLAGVGTAPYCPATV